MKISAGLVRKTIRIKFFLEKNNVSFHIQDQKKKIKLKVELKKQSQISGKQSYLKRLIKLTILWINCLRQKKKKREKTKIFSIRNETKKGHPSKSYKHLKHKEVLIFRNLMPTNSTAWVKWRNPLADKLPKLTCSLKK